MRVEGKPELVILVKSGRLYDRIVAKHVGQQVSLPDEYACASKKRKIKAILLHFNLRDHYLYLICIVIFPYDEK